MKNINKEAKAKIEAERRNQKNNIFKWSHQIIISDYFKIFISAAIFANVIVQAFDEYPIPSYAKHMDEISSYFSYIFIIELTLKLFGLGFK